MTPLLAPLGILLPASVLQSDAFGLLAAFVALNTIVYLTLAVAKMLPKVYLSDYTGGRNRRRETRSIHPDAPANPGL